MTIFPMRNPVQSYDWGCSSEVTKLFGIENPDQQPVAEIWMGAHPKAPSIIVRNNELITLDEMLEQEPEHLGTLPKQLCNKKLPFLFKVLSAGSPLSIQVHPDKAQAKIGFDLENEAGILLDAFNRNYRDDNHKPELVYALTPFKAMNGFREIKEIIKLFRLADLDMLNPPLLELEQACSKKALKIFYKYLMTLKEGAKATLLKDTEAFIRQTENPAWLEVSALNKVYPGDIGILSPLFLNVVHLQPGEAMFLNAGTLHAYMKGTALEIMACSDNVLRGGLTSKYIDIDELLKTLTFQTTSHDLLLAESGFPKKYEQSFKIPVSDFALSIISIDKSSETLTNEAAEILFCIDGHLSVSSCNGDLVSLNPGESCFISALSKCVTITGRGRIARAAVAI